MAHPINRKLVIFLGGSSGLGFAALESLLSSGTPYHIVLGSRHPLEQHRFAELRPLLDSSKSVLDRYECDLSKYASVHKFVETVLAKHGGEPIDALVLCAGMIAYNHRTTADREDEAVQVNVLSQALIIDLLEQKLGADGHPCRILFVGSSLHRQVLPGQVTPEDFHNDYIAHDYDGKRVYEITKFIQIFLLYMTQERFISKPNVTAVVVSPGFVPDTGLSRELGIVKHGFMKYLLPQTPFATTIPDGGRNIAFGITQNFASGTYFTQRKVEETAEETYDPDLRERWLQWFLSRGIWHVAEKPAPTPTSTSAAPAPGPVPAVQAPTAEAPAEAAATPAPAPVAVEPAQAPVPPPKDQAPTAKAAPTPTQAATTGSSTTTATSNPAPTPTPGATAVAASASTSGGTTASEPTPTPAPVPAPAPVPEPVPAPTPSTSG